jgi:hypothetical protein
MFVCLPHIAHAKLEIVSVQTEGVGITRAEAISDAVVQAISQVNGAEIAASTMSSVKEQTSASKDDSAYSMEEAYQKDIKSKTKGIVQGWSVDSERQAEELSNRWLVKLTVKISKYKTSKQLSRLRMALGKFRVSDVGKEEDLRLFQRAFTRKLQDYLTQTRKFSMLDREFLEEQNTELSAIASGGFIDEELARLGNMAGTDYLFVGVV